MAERAFTLSDIAARFDLRATGPHAGTLSNAATISGVAPLATAEECEIAFLANPLYRHALGSTRAGAVVLQEADAINCPVPSLITPDPYAAFARIATLFEMREAMKPGIHPSAIVDASAQIDPSASVGPLVSVGARSRIGPRVRIGAGCIVGDDCVMGADCELVARVTLARRVRLGQRVLIHPGAVIGADGFGIAMHEGAWLKVPQLGGVVIGDDCEIGANTTIDRGALDDTVLEEDVRLDNQIQVGHNVHIGAHTAIAGCAAIAGSARIGRYCLIGGGAGVVGHISLCDNVVLTAMSLATHSIREPGEYSSGTPIQSNRAWRKNAARFKQLDALARRIRHAKGSDSDFERDPQ